MGELRFGIFNPFSRFRSSIGSTRATVAFLTPKRLFNRSNLTSEDNVEYSSQPRGEVRMCRTKCVGIISGL